MIFKQLITNLGIHCALKMSGCQSFYGFMYPLKMNHQNFTLDGILKNMSGNPGILGIFSIAQSHIHDTSCNSDYNLTVQCTAKFR